LIIEPSPGKKRFTSRNIARDLEFEGLIAVRVGFNASPYPRLYETPGIPAVEA
jgi:hypothetical protein